MSNTEDDLQSISVVGSSSSRRNPRNNRNKTIAARAETFVARSEAADLRATIAEQVSEINDLKCQIAVLQNQLAESRSGVSTLIRHLPGNQDPAPHTHPRLVASAPPRHPTPPSQAFRVPSLPEPPFLDPGCRRVVADPSVPPLPYAAPASRHISERLGGFPARPDILRSRSHRDRSSSPSERRHRPRRSSPSPPGASEPPPPRRAQNPSFRRL